MSRFVVKLRIAFLQHITTLSGAAILIILAFIQRAGTAKELLLANAIPLFALAALISVLGVVWLISINDTRLPVHARGSRGAFATAWAGASFSGAVVFAAFFDAGVYPSLHLMKPLLYVGGGLAVASYALLRLLRWLSGRARNSSGRRS